MNHVESDTAVVVQQSAAAWAPWLPVEIPRRWTVAELIRWQDIAPGDAVDINLIKRLDITAPLNEDGERCPWPWEAQQLVNAPLGPFRCSYCFAMCVAGMEHFDYTGVTFADGGPGKNNDGGPCTGTANECRVCEGFDCPPRDPAASDTGSESTEEGRG